MFETVYACLLRLFPLAFRRQYQQEALQLFRDRLRDERGLLRRLRLVLDLTVDLAGGLPQAWRNSYGEVPAVASLATQVDGIPSFGSLQKEPIRREAVVLAGVLSVTALVAFTFVMNLPVPYRSSAQNGRQSPIESVMERLNQPISPDATNSGESEAPKAASFNTGQTDVGSSATHPLAASAKQDPSPLQAAAVPPLSAQAQAGAIPIPTPVVSPSGIRAVGSASVEVNLSGRWTGSLAAAGAERHLPQSFIFHQDSVRLTGTAVSDSGAQYAITHGVVAGNSVSFELTDGKSTFRYDLQIEGKALQGYLSIRSMNAAQSTPIWLTPVQ
jgi:hypothetical protein